MDPRLLRLYSDELSHLREVGAEFAREFPKIAARLGVEGAVRQVCVRRLAAAQEGEGPPPRR